MTVEVIACEQGTEAWYRARLGIPTASSFADVLAKGEGKTRRSYMLKLAGEILTGEPTENFMTPAMDRGKAMEDEARSMYAFMFNAEPERVGFVRNGDKGCSPDSFLGPDGGLEIKTKRSDLLLDVIIRDRIPPEHIPQCQGFLWVAEREWIDFVAYWPRLPLFVKRAYRDEPYIKNLASEVARFNEELYATVEMIRRYGEAA
jgi:YqaJ-like viral recombinase domain